MGSLIIGSHLVPHVSFKARRLTIKRKNTCARYHCRYLGAKEKLVIQGPGLHHILPQRLVFVRDNWPIHCKK